MLEVNNLQVRLQTQRGPADAVRGVSFGLQRGQAFQDDPVERVSQCVADEALGRKRLSHGALRRYENAEVVKIS